MEQKKLKNYALLEYLSSLPKKMLSIQHYDNIPGFVLHDLCLSKNFNITKAAYLVDNPDFNCLRGVTGFCKDEAYQSCDIWDAPEDFSKHILKCPFHEKVA